MFRLIDERDTRKPTPSYTCRQQTGWTNIKGVAVKGVAESGPNRLEQWAVRHTSSEGTEAPLLRSNHSTTQSRLVSNEELQRDKIPSKRCESHRKTCSRQTRIHFSETGQCLGLSSIPRRHIPTWPPYLGGLFRGVTIDAARYSWESDAFQAMLLTEQERILPARYGEEGNTTASISMRLHYASPSMAAQFET